MDLRDISKEVFDAFNQNFGRTPLRQRLEDIQGETTELCRFTDLRNLQEETGDLLSSTLALCAENEWDAETLVRDTLAKIKKRKMQYRSLGRKVKVALIGGAYDPVTCGHIKLAQFVLNSSRTFDEVHLVPCYSHMFGKQMATPEHRLEMCKLASKVDGRIRVFDYEIKHKLKGETYHFLKRLLAEDFAKDEFDYSYVIGLDNANNFHNWVNYEDLERMMRFVVVGRQGVQRNEKVNWYLRQPHIYLVPEKDDIPEISSTMIRNAIIERNFHSLNGGEYKVEFLAANLNPDVLDFINRNNLYEATYC